MHLHNTLDAVQAGIVKEVPASFDQLEKLQLVNTYGYGLYKVIHTKLIDTDQGVEYALAVKAPCGPDKVHYSKLERLYAPDIKSVFKADLGALYGADDMFVRLHAEYKGEDNAFLDNVSRKGHWGLGPGVDMPLVKGINKWLESLYMRGKIPYMQEIKGYVVLEGALVPVCTALSKKGKLFKTTAFDALCVKS